MNVNRSSAARHRTTPESDESTPSLAAVHVCGITPGVYEGNEAVELLREFVDDPDAIRFIADMLEE